MLVVLRRHRGRFLGPTYDAIVARLDNWGRFARENPDVPHCGISAIYDGWSPYGSGRDEGWGEAEAPPHMEDFDEEDAEVMDGWIRQLPCVAHRVTIVRKWQWCRAVGHAEVRAAVMALVDLMQQNRRVVDRMER